MERISCCIFDLSSWIVRGLFAYTWSLSLLLSNQVNVEAIQNQNLERLLDPETSQLTTVLWLQLSGVATIFTAQGGRKICRPPTPTLAVDNLLTFEIPESLIKIRLKI